MLSGHSRIRTGCPERMEIKIAGEDSSLLRFLIDHFADITVESKRDIIFLFFSIISSGETLRINWKVQHFAKFKIPFLRIKIT